MRIARFTVGDEVSYGLVGTAREGSALPGGPAAGDLLIAELAGHPFGGGRDSTRLTGTTYQVAEIRLLAPVLPSKVICFDRAGAGAGAGAGDVLYLKPSTAVCGPGDPVRYPGELSQRVEAGGELAVVIGRLCRQISPEQAAAVIAGFTCALNVVARDLAERDGQWARAVGFDTFCPLGPWIETDAAGAELVVATTVNGAARQRGRARWPDQDVLALVSYASSVMTLLPGDVLLTGMPGEAVAAGAGSLDIGDEVSVTIDGIGTLTNKVDKGD